jgi:low temperature requirement protein LtrA
MRVFYVVLANLALPFLLFYLRNALYKAYYVLVLKNKEKQAPKLDRAMAIKLLIAGVLLLGSILVYARLNVQQEPRGDYNQVNQYNFR